MIVGIGIDSVEISRFAQWRTFAQKQLLKIFTPGEIEYCLRLPTKSAERFAVRFAAKEAFYKALTREQQCQPFMTVARFIEIKHDEQHKPYLLVDWQVFLDKQSTPTLYRGIIIHVSLTHTKHTATAFVVLESA